MPRVTGGHGEEGGAAGLLHGQVHGAQHAARGPHVEHQVGVPGGGGGKEHDMTQVPVQNGHTQGHADLRALLSDNLEQLHAMIQVQLGLLAVLIVFLTVILTLFLTFILTVILTIIFTVIFAVILTVILTVF